jgi:predicted transcriptional regulator
MPKPGPRRPYVAVRLDPDTLEWLDSEAARRDVYRSVIIREALIQARKTITRAVRRTR